MKKKIENAYAKALTGTFKAVNPIKKSIIKTDCKIHLYINEDALNILNLYGYKSEYGLFLRHIHHVNRGLIWADQDFKSYHHFYNPKERKGMYGYEDNALTVSKNYYSKALKYAQTKEYSKSMFYFGAACHIIQDLTIPQHAKGKLFDNHRQFEIYVRLNYKKIEKLKSKESPIILSDIESYADYNSTYALTVDHMYKDISDAKARFYLTALKAVPLAQRTSAGCMIMFYRDLKNI